MRLKPGCRFIPDRACGDVDEIAPVFDFLPDAFPDVGSGGVMAKVDFLINRAVTPMKNTFHRKVASHTAANAVYSAP